MRKYGVFGNVFPLCLTVITTCLATHASAQSYPSVTAHDITLQAPIPDNLPLFVPNVGYDDGSAGTNEPPLYTPYNSGTTQWWDNLVQELVQAGTPVVNLEDRGLPYGNPNPVPIGPGTAGNEDPRRLTAFFDAAARQGAGGTYFSAICFIDTAGAEADYSHFGYPLLLANQTYWKTIWWTDLVEPWFNTVPRQNWYTINGRPVISIWSVGFWTDSVGNEVPLLNYLEQKFIATYGVDPVFELAGSWFRDPAVAKDSAVLFDNEWFSYPSGYDWASLGSRTAGAIVPGWDSVPSKIIERKNGQTLQADLQAAANANVTLMDLEGWTDLYEGMGYYRSLDPAWSFPSQYINIVRKYSDLRTVTTRLEAEGADQFYPVHKPGTVFRADGLNVVALTGNDAGWAVTDMPAGGWIQFDEVAFSPGNYKFPVRYASTASHTLQLSIDGVALPPQIVPSTGSLDTYNTVYLAYAPLTYGTHTLRLTWVDGGPNVDWLFAKKYDPMMGFKATSTDSYITALHGGNDTVVSNRTVEGTWERFSVDDLSGAGTVSDGDTVNLQTYNGSYLTATNGGGSTLDAGRRVPSVWEKFKVIKVGGTGAIAQGDRVAFKSDDGVHYLSAINPTTIDVSGTSIGSEQTFTVTVTDQ